MTLTPKDVEFIVCETGSVWAWSYAPTREGAERIAAEQMNEKGKPFEVLPVDEFTARQTRHYLEEFPLSEITEEFYFEMLNCLPPMHRAGAMGFFMVEMTSGSITSQFVEYRGKFYGGAADVLDRSTWITPQRIDALPTDRKRLEWFNREEGS